MQSTPNDPVYPLMEVSTNGMADPLADMDVFVAWMVKPGAAGTKAAPMTGAYVNSDSEKRTGTMYLRMARILLSTACAMRSR